MGMGGSVLSRRRGMVEMKWGDVCVCGVLMRVF